MPVSELFGEATLPEIYKFKSDPLQLALTFSPPLLNVSLEAGAGVAVGAAVAVVFVVWVVVVLVELFEELEDEEVLPELLFELVDSELDEGEAVDLAAGVGEAFFVPGFIVADGVAEDDASMASILSPSAPLSGVAWGSPTGKFLITRKPAVAIKITSRIISGGATIPF